MRRSNSLIHSLLTCTDAVTLLIAGSPVRTDPADFLRTALTCGDRAHAGFRPADYLRTDSVTAMTDTPEPRSAIFARKVRQLRTERGWSQTELGRRLGTSGQALRQSRVAVIEQTGHVTLDQAQSFADAFLVPIEALIYDEPPQTAPVVREQLIKIITALDAVREQCRQLETADSVRTSYQWHRLDLRLCPACGYPPSSRRA